MDFDPNALSMFAGQKAVSVNSDTPETPPNPLVEKAAPVPAPVLETITFAGFTRIANDDDFKAWLRDGNCYYGPELSYGQPRVPNHYPFWVRVNEDGNPQVLSKDDVQALYDSTQRAISLYGHWVVERRAWFLDDVEKR